MMNPWVFVLLFQSIVREGSADCAKIPDGITSPSTMQDPVRFEIGISGNPDTYVPGEQYTVYVRSTNPMQEDGPKFMRFVLYLENSTTPIGEPNPNVGTLQVSGDGLSRMSDDCPDMVVEADMRQKTEVQALWVAPIAKTGCVYFKAIVVESSKLWYNEHGPLTKMLCGEVEDEGDTQPSILRHCCACDEAKYEVTFEGLWSRNTHPKEFPPNG